MPAPRQRRILESDLVVTGGYHDALELTADITGGTKDAIGRSVRIRVERDRGHRLILDALGSMSRHHRITAWNNTPPKERTEGLGSLLRRATDDELRAELELAIAERDAFEARLTAFEALDR